MTSSSAPRMVNSYKRTSSPRSPTNTGELFTPAHEENVRFIHDKACTTKQVQHTQDIFLLSGFTDPNIYDRDMRYHEAAYQLAWQCVLRDIRSTQNSERNDRGPQEYVEKNPNPNLHSFTPVDLSDLKKRNTQDSKKS
ncbi:mapk-regulated corepressor-interacting protein 1 isoform X1 [Micropterus salmoides]|uniref:mapk-regulated corepressor-interacting protein 1 isoform X1 n=1 Tax=Micropterus salmoides TaxID=27706 RepID=UPI0018EC0AD7|nr:mapk-regulated corepressor-interacting protein 1 isoform X1 [Micropterus salmoides]XP_045899565.1 mapk-regulated corepressor-interacting protein 1 isoform X1 [Micropterus dolomieu]XP_045899566.1 mapk-regulated corepressor-interacting protein 1 isoform X1 [Micropterus dolomieu]XP_045899568.1 mapk-regulated corepressor-interacting protein 1 isoform X1 [Micropterus dolomieu]